MKHWTLSASTAIGLVLSAGSALAITPEEVWENWKGVTASTGGTVTTTSEARNGDVLEIRGITSSSQVAEGGEFTSTIDLLTLTDRGDGTVEVKMSDTIPLIYNEDDAKDGKPTLSLQLSQPGAVVIASGTPEATNYEFTLPELKIDLVEGYDDDGEKVDVAFSATAADLSGTYLVSPGADGVIGLQSAVKTGAVKVTTSGNDEGTTFNVAFDLAGLTSSAGGSLVDQSLMLDMSRALAEGFALDSKSDLGAMSLTVEIDDKGTKSSFSAALDSAAFHALLDKVKLDYGFSFMAGRFATDMPETGMPAGDASFSEVTFAVAMPVAVSDLASDFSLLTRLGDVTLSDSLWGLFDPQGALARDPATLVVDVKGKGALLADIFNGEASDSPDLPMRLDSLDLAQVLIKLVAAEVSANGALTFDNSDKTTFQGFPAPEGKITVNMSGISVLLDKLVALGFISADDLGGVRMGLAMFARPGPGPDQLVTEIEFRNKGLFVNGQQIM